MSDLLTPADLERIEALCEQRKIGMPAFALHAANNEFIGVIPRAIATIRHYRGLLVRCMYTAGIGQSLHDQLEAALGGTK